jgi:hypothetical protein
MMEDGNRLAESMAIAIGPTIAPLSYLLIRRYQGAGSSREHEITALRLPLRNELPLLDATVYAPQMPVRLWIGGEDGSRREPCHPLPSYAMSRVDDFGHPT